jgi:hypothetical protein
MEDVLCKTEEPWQTSKCIAKRSEVQVKLDWKLRWSRLGGFEVLLYIASTMGLASMSLEHLFQFFFIVFILVPIVVNVFGEW